MVGVESIAVGSGEAGLVRSAASGVRQAAEGCRWRR